MIIIISIIIICLIIIIIKKWNYKIEHYQNLTLPEYSPSIINPFGNSEEVYNDDSNKIWYKEPDADGLPYYLLKGATVDPKLVVLPEQLTKTNRKYMMGIVKFDNSFNDKINTQNYDKYINKNNITDLMNFSKFNEPDKLLTQDERNLFLQKINNTTWLNRWKDYNPNVDFSLNDKYIKSSINDVNIIIKYVSNKINHEQNNLLSQQELLTFGKSIYIPFIYKIENIQTDKKNIIYEINIVMYRDNIQYAPNFYFKSSVINELNKKVIIFDFDFIGYFLTDMLLLPNGVEAGNEKLYTYFDLNSNYRLYGEPLEKDLLKTVYAVDQYEDSFKLKNQYVCFSTDYNNYLTPSATSSILLSDNNMNSCQSIYNVYGKQKPSGLWDKPCSENEDCPFYKANANYNNKKGICNKSTGYCELPLGMKNMGYHYFIPTSITKPYCYNCKSTKSWKPITNLDTCCIEQNDRKKYPFLKSPDFAYSGDLNERINYINNKNCYLNSEGNNVC